MSPPSPRWWERRLGARINGGCCGTGGAFLRYVRASRGDETDTDESMDEEPPSLDRALKDRWVSREAMAQLRKKELCAYFVLKRGEQYTALLAERDVQRLRADPKFVSLRPRPWVVQPAEGPEEHLTTAELDARIASGASFLVKL